MTEEKKVTELEERVKKLEVSEEAKLKKKNRIAILAHIALILFMCLPIAIDASTWWLNLSISVWVGIVLLKQLVINRQDHTINMLYGIAKITYDVSKESIKEWKESKRGSTNAKRNRKS